MKTEKGMKSMKNEKSEMQALHSAALAGEGAPQRVLLAPWGPVESTNGSFVVDEESARLAVAAFEDHGTDLPIDYEHQTLGGSYASPSGQAPAAGWIKRVFAESGVGLLAEIEWTEQAKQRLTAKEYRYLSPVAIIRKTDRKLVAIHSAALTNKPAIVGMQPIVNRRTPLDPPLVSGEALETADVEPLALLRNELQLPAETEAEELLVAASERLMEMKREASRRHIDERVAAAMRAGKLVEAQREWAEALVACEEELFEEWFRTAPVIVQPGRSAPPTPHDAGERRHHALAAKARAEYRTNRLLAGLTSEEAYVAHAMRAAVT